MELITIYLITQLPNEYRLGIEGFETIYPKSNETIM